MFKKRWGQPTTTICLISHKNINFARAAHFFLHLPLFCTTTTIKIPQTSLLHVLLRKCMCSCSLLFHCSSFSPWWPLVFLIFSPPLSNFHVFRPKKLASVVFYFSLSYRQNARGAWNANFHPQLHEGVNARTYGRFCKNRNFLDT